MAYGGFYREMFYYEWIYVVLLMTVFTNVNSSSLRKIKDGKAVDEAMRYMVYLTKAEKSETNYDAWICGGSIVSPDFILTSAACVQDVKYMYAIAGYNKYVNTKDIDNDECTKHSKKKVVLTCVPKAYDFDYHKIEKWAFIDIALVKVESPYDFSAAAPIQGCSHVPNKIDVNYEAKYQAPNTDAMILGWGHKDKWRQKSDTTDHNQDILQYSPILIMDKNECKNQYSSDNKELLPLIDKYMICAMNDGNIDDKGKLIKRSKPVDGCDAPAIRIGGICQEVGENIHEQPKIQFRFRIQDENRSIVNPAPKSAPPSHNDNKDIENDDIVTFEDIMSNIRRLSSNGTVFSHARKAGICQNDHGGPLITWVGKREHLIGVASVFRLAEDLSCIGPYLFTSTQCNSAFIDCVINHSDKSKLKATKPPDPTCPTTPTTTPVPNICDLPPKERGFDITKRRISWSSHPDGPAANELKEDLFIRPVMPLRD